MKSTKTTVPRQKKMKIKLTQALCLLFSFMLIFSSCAVNVTFDPNGAEVISGELEQKI